MKNKYLRNRYSNYKFFDTSGRFLPLKVIEVLRQDFKNVYSVFAFPKEEEIKDLDISDVIRLLYKLAIERAMWQLHWEEGELRSFSEGMLFRDGDTLSALGEMILEIGYQTGNSQDFLPPEYQAVIKGFDPVIDSETKVLILGTLPGIKSLRIKAYYANPQNQFWNLLGNILNKDLNMEYKGRLWILVKNGVGIADVLREAEREGSLDSQIRRKTAVCVNFQKVFARCPNLRAIMYNGKKAEELFQKMVMPTLEDDIRERLNFIPLPSSSSAHRKMSFEGKLDIWKKIKEYL